MKKRAGILLANSVFTILLLFAAAELLLRLINFPFHRCPRIINAPETKMTHFDPLLGWSYTPGKITTGEYGETYTFSAEGYRSEALTDRSAKNKPTIILVGDSILFGHGIDFRDSIGYKLQKALENRYQVLNFSVQGYGNDQMLLLAKKLVPKYRPAVVISNYLTNHDYRNLSSDRREIFPCYRYSGSKPRFDIKNDQLVLAVTAKPPEQLYDWRVKLLISNFLKRLGLFPQSANANLLTKRIIDESRAYVEKNGGKFILIAFNADSFYGNENFVLHINTTDRKNGDKYYISASDHHPNATAASEIVKSLLDKYKNLLK